MSPFLGYYRLVVFACISSVDVVKLAARTMTCLDYIPLIPGGIGLAGQNQKDIPAYSIIIFLFDNKPNRSIVPFS